MTETSKVFQLRKLADVPASFVPDAGMRECRIIFKHTEEMKAKGQAKIDSQFCVLPVLSDAFLQSFLLNEKGKELIRGYVESLQDGVVRKIWTDSKRSPCEADFSIESLVEVGEATSAGFRLSGKLIEDVFKSTWRNEIAAGLALERCAEFLVAAESGEEDKIRAFWNSELGAKMQTIAGNYLGYLVRAATQAKKRPGFESQAIKDMILKAIGFCEETALVQRVKKELEETPIASADTSGL